MPILTLILIIIVVGVLLWAVNAIVPMEPKVKQILNVVVILVLVLWLVSVFFGVDLGTIGGGRRVPVIR